MKILRGTIVLTLLAVMHSAVVLADDRPSPKDAKAVAACLRAKATPNSDACIGVVANPCIGPDEAAKAPGDIIDCFGREQMVWDQMLNDAFRQLRDGLDDDQRGKLRDMQRAWITMRDSTCAFYYDYFQGSMANPMMANCSNRETARRAIFLSGFADDLAGSVKAKRR